MDKLTRFHQWIVFLVCCLFTVVSFASSNIGTNTSKQDNVLFVMLSKEAAIKARPSKDNSYQLTLNGVHSSVTYFTERPARVSNSMVISKFLQQWSSGSFKSDPPNAVLHAIDIPSNAKGEPHSVNYAVVLTNPQYDKVHDRLTFDIQPLKGSAALTARNTHTDYAALFIDDVCLSCL